MRERGNHTEYCNRTATNLLARSDRELNPAKRLALIMRVGKIFANDVPMIPLFQKPTYLVYKTSVKGMVDNPLEPGPQLQRGELEQSSGRARHKEQ